MKPGKLKVYIKLFRSNKNFEVEYIYKKKHEDERPMVLDVLLQAQEESLDDLSFRYGCRARNCGVCTIDINGKPRLACRARVKDGDIISPISTLPVIKDLIVKRDNISRQLVGFNNISNNNNLNIEAEKSYHNLTACIECYACLHNCPLHKLNDLKLSQKEESFKYGNPFSFLKLQRKYLDPLTPDVEKSKLIDKAIDLGLEVCKTCPGCKCGVGINLKDDVIMPLLKNSFNK
jgi:succinate dehydrogenase/fumarate reductase iron-sulfur protein|tara:strand:- start:110 stop:808 length:699 start_codon:yes stop_codon:yes gene_type:complete